MSLRDYQQLSIDQIREHYRQGTKKVLLHLATGGGKTVVFSDVLRTTAYNGHRAIMVVRGRKLVDQASQRLFREGVHHGVLMSGHWNYRPSAPIQICSIDTLIARNLYPAARLIVLDEAHYCTSPGYLKFIEQYPDSFILAVTATPYVDKSLRHVAEAVVHPITMIKLIEQGFLVDARYFAPSEPDLQGVRVSSSTKDYMAEDLSQAMQKGSLVGDLVHHWKTLGQNRATLCFAATVGHSKNIVEQFREAGIRAEHCDADTPEPEREKILKRAESGETKVISNVGIFCTGVDLPFIGCIVMARPTKSYNLYIQQAGRGTRPFHGKSDFIILDHAGNVHKHGFITEEPEASLDGKPLKKTVNPKTCSQCYAVFIGFKCPSCGYTKPVEETVSREVVVTDGNLEEIIEMPFDSQVRREIERLEKRRKAIGVKKGWTYFRLVEMYGQEVADRFMPKRSTPFWVNGGAHGAGERNPGGTLSEAEHQMLEITKDPINGQRGLG